MKLIAYPFHDWRKGSREGFRTRDGHILQQGMHRPDIELTVIVNRPMSLAERYLRGRGTLDGARGVLAERRTHGYRGTITQVDHRAVVVDVDTPDVIRPMARPRRWWFDVFDNVHVIELIGWAANEMGAASAPSIAWVPTVAPTIEALRPTRFVYDSLDNWLIHPTLRKEATRADDGYHRLIPAATRVFASAPRSAEVLARYRPDIHVLPNGVDSASFAQRRARPTDLPSGPIVGYAGKLSSRIDTRLIDEVAERLPAIQFVFAGPVLDPTVGRRLKSRPNIHMLGDRHYSELPAYVQNFDVGWIPHTVGEGETGGDPIKLYEYWAAGIPVVSTKIDGMERWGAEIALIDDARGGERAIQLMLEQPRIASVPPEREWSAITESILRVLMDQTP